MGKGAPGRTRSLLTGPGALLAFIAVAFAVFGGAVRNGYVSFDDDSYIVLNSTVNNRDGLTRIWAGTRTQMYYPLVFSSFWAEKHAEVELGLIKPDEPASPAINHAINIVLHGAAGFMLLCCLRRLGMPTVLAWIAALLWLVHPLQTEAVIWAVQRKSTLAALFAFGCVLSYLRARRAAHRPADEAAVGNRRNAGDPTVRGVSAAPQRTTPRASAPRSRLGWYALSLALFACSQLSKPAAILLPLTLLLLEWLLARGIDARAVLRTLPFWIVSGVFVGITIAGEHTAIINDLPTPPQRIFIAAQALCFYLWKLVWPVKLVSIYPRWDPAIDFTGVAALSAWTVAGAAWIWAAWRYRAGPPRPVAALLIASAYYVTMLAPVSGLVAMGYSEFAFVANHFSYLPLVAPVVLLALLIGRVLRPFGRPWAPAAAGAVLIGICAIVSNARVPGWRDTATLMADVLRVNPRCPQAHVMLAYDLWSRDRHDPRTLPVVERHMLEALRLRPTFADGHFALAGVYAETGRVREALAHMEEALRGRPAMFPYRTRLAQLYMRVGDFGAALRHLEQLPDEIRVRSDVLPLRIECLMRLGRFEEAARLKQAAPLRPERAP